MALFDTNDVVAATLNPLIEKKFTSARGYASLYRVVPTDSLTVEHEYESSNLGIGKINPPGGSGYTVGVTAGSSALFRLFEHRPHTVLKDSDALWLRAPGTVDSPIGPMEATRKAVNYLTETDINLVEYCAQKHIFYPNTFTVPRADGGTVTFTSDIPSTQVTAVAASWKTAGTDIIAQLEAKAVAIQDAWGVRPDTLYMNGTTFRATLLVNTEFLKFWGIPGIAAEFWRSGNLPEWQGWKLKIVNDRYNSATIDEAASNAYVLPNDRVMLAPADLSALGPVWYQAKPQEAGAPGGPSGYGRFLKTWKCENPSGQNLLLEHVFRMALSTPCQHIWPDITAT